MKNLFNRSQIKFRKELKKRVRETAEQGKPIKVLDDIVFKAMLGSDTEDSNEALRSLLSACTHREITSVSLANTELLPAHLEAKTSRLDVHATFNDGEAADLEMQIGISDDDLKARAELYVSMLLASQSRKGRRYEGIKRVYQIFFLNCVLFPKSDKLPRRYSYREEEEHDRLNELTEIIFYEMPKLERRVRDCLEGKIAADALSEEERWCIYMKYRHEKQAGRLIEDLCRKEEGIMRAEKTVNGISKDYLKAAREMAIIKNRWDRERAELRAKREAEEKGLAEGLAKGLAEGLAKGHAEGRAEGITEGLVEGRAEGITEGKLEIARKMKKAGLPLSEITEFTGLPPKTVQEL
jgi:predicted transposase/invertase (TIGR01784 family)